MIETALLLSALARVRRLRPYLLSRELFDHLAAAAERRFGARRWALLAGLLLLGLAALYVRPAIHATTLGGFYVRLASDPFSQAPNPVGYRILTPLISYALGLRGGLLLVTNLAFAALFLAMIYRYFAARAARPGDALFAALVFTYSLVTLTSVYYGGYCDSLSYVLLLAMWWWRARRPLFYLFFLLGLLNRESVAFLVPWFAYLTLREVRPGWRAVLDLLLGFGACFALYVGFRAWIAHGHEIRYTLSFYLEPIRRDPLHWIRQSGALWWLGLFTVFKILWVFPVAAGISAWRGGQRPLVYSMLLLTACSLAQLVVAFDSSRMLTLGFLAQLVALEHLFAAEAEGMRNWGRWVLLANLFVPQLFSARNIIEPMYSPLARALIGLVGARP